MKISAALRTEKSKSEVSLAGVFLGDEKKCSGFLGDPDAKSFLSDLAKSNRFSGKEGALFFTCLPNDVKRGIFVAGLGEKKKFSATRLRHLGSAFLAKLKDLRFERGSIVLDSLVGNGISYADATMALVEGIRLKEYRFDKFKSKEKKSEKPDVLKEIVLMVPDRKAFDAVKIGRASCRERVYVLV